ncbi:Signal transduction protein [Coemansia sp. RSA 1813]|nr:Xenotropic and polytropic retrovirus receptor 1 [Coemansia sp. RSA 1646]KAJ1771366.1 Signal transduction protein [Coemansia sp. RSA 1843]KAJ2217595.1 Signal transduction protein [Coemansia sp. RSA 487]KAJ2573392.1 Signal transduction protein [Coemansia sp. RSA 1813]
MKFGKYLEAEQVPEWEKMYVSYRALKRLVKKIALAKEARMAGPSEEKTSLLRRASTYLGYSSMISKDSSSSSPTRTTDSATISPTYVGPSTPTPVFARTNPMPGSSTSCQGAPVQEEQNKNGKDIVECCSNASCSTCSHFNSIVSATPQLALSMSAANSGKVGATPTDLAHCANIKLPMSAQDTFSELVRRRKTPVASDCVSLDEFKSELKERIPEEQDFFERLEQELAKVNDFYKQKQALFQTRLDNIKKQQDIYDTMFGEELEASALRSNIERSRVTFNRTLTNSGSSRNKQHAFEPSAQLRAAKEKLKSAMLEIYRGMELLKNYRVLCYTAFIKALKKYQKTAGWCRGTDHFLNRVDGCYIATSERLNTMSAELEGMYVARYAGGSRSKGMEKLRVNANGGSGGSPVCMFRSGLMLGTSVPLIVRAIYEANLLSNEQRVPYHRQLLQLYGSIYLVLLFMILFSLNIMAWTRAHINYRFIFEVDPRDYLDSWQFLEISSFFFFVASVVFWVNFALHIEHNSYICIYVLLGVLFGLFLAPVNAFYWSSRRWLIKSLWRLLLSGFYRVEFRDFFLGDEMCSLTYTFSMLLMFGCASANHWTDLDDVCNTTQWWSNAAFLMLPNLLRLIQCIRRFRDSGDAFPHLANGAKYLSTIITIWLASSNRIVGGTAWRSIWVASAIVNSCFTSLWDLLMDWGLFESRSKHRFLRSELKFERAWVYYVAIVVDVLLRFFWITQISPNFFSFGHKFHQATMAYIAAVFEVVRRFSWNFFRVENEHISNCGQFRATTDIPLPFNPSQAQDTKDINVFQNEFEHDYSVIPVGSPRTPHTTSSPLGH